MIEQDNNITINNLITIKSLPLNRNSDDIIKYLDKNFNYISSLDFDFETACYILNRACELGLGFGSNFEKNIKYILICNNSRDDLFEYYKLNNKLDDISKIKDPILFKSFIDAFNIDKEILINKRKKYIQDTVSEYLDFMMYSIDEDNNICSSDYYYKDDKKLDECDMKTCVLDFISQYFNNSSYNENCLKIKNINIENLNFEEMKFVRDYLDLKNRGLMDIADFFKKNEYINIYFPEIKQMIK